MPSESHGRKKKENRIITFFVRGRAVDHKNAPNTGEVTGGYGEWLGQGIKRGQRGAYVRKRVV